MSEGPAPSTPVDSSLAGSLVETGKNLTAVGMLILTASICAAQLLIRPGLPVAHDMVFHLFQADQFYRGIASGALLPRWAMSADNGYGSPNFIFYSPLGYYLAALLRIVVPSPIFSMIIAIWCSFLLSGAAMYMAVKRISGSRGALLSAVLYQSLPFHLLNLYGRGAFAELCAYAWFPLVILFMHETLSERHAPSASAGLSLSYAGLILTHLVSAFMFTFVLLFYTACHHYFHRSGKALLRASLALVCGLGISSFYLLPVIFERKYVQMEYLLNYVFSDYRQNFLSLKNSFATPFLATLHGAVILEMVLLFTCVPLLFNRGDEQSAKPHRTTMCLLFGVAFILATALSTPVWRYVPFFETLQFPWRWLTVMELSLCFMAGAAISGTGPSLLRHAGSSARMVLYCIFALFSVSLLLIVRSDRMHSSQFLESITDAEQVKRYTNLPREYTPIWATDVEKTITEENGEKISLLTGKAGLRVLDWEPERRVVGISAYQPVLLRIATFYYPGWEAAIDGKMNIIAIEKKSGAMLVDVPQGEHILKLTFGDTPLRLFSRYVSYGSCAVLALFALFPRGKQGHRLSLKVVIPVKTGIQCFYNRLKFLDSRFRGNDENM